MKNINIMNIANESFKTKCLFYADFLRFLKDKNIFKKFMFNYINGYRYDKEKNVFNFITQFYNFNSIKPFYMFFGSIIMSAFCWRETKEGVKFWNSVYEECQKLKYEHMLKNGRQRNRNRKETTVQILERERRF